MPEQDIKPSSVTAPTPKPQRSVGALEFPNIQAVFGRDDYNVRISIAQVLKNHGRDLFPSEHHAPLEGEHAKITGYTGTSKQNVEMQKLSIAVLQPLKKEILDCDRRFPECAGIYSKK